MNINRICVFQGDHLPFLYTQYFQMTWPMNIPMKTTLNLILCGLLIVTFTGCKDSKKAQKNENLTSRIKTIVFKEKTEQDGKPDPLMSDTSIMIQHKDSLVLNLTDSLVFDLRPTRTNTSPLWNNSNRYN